MPHGAAESRSGRRNERPTRSRGRRFCIGAQPRRTPGAGRHNSHKTQHRAGSAAHNAGTRPLIATDSCCLPRTALSSTRPSTESGASQMLTGRPWMAQEMGSAAQPISCANVLDTRYPSAKQRGLLHRHGFLGRRGESWGIVRHHWEPHQLVRALIRQQAPPRQRGGSRRGPDDM